MFVKAVCLSMCWILYTCVQGTSGFNYLHERSNTLEYVKQHKINTIHRHLVEDAVYLTMMDREFIMIYNIVNLGEIQSCAHSGFVFNLNRFSLNRVLCISVAWGLFPDFQWKDQNVVWWTLFSASDQVQQKQYHCESNCLEEFMFAPPKKNNC